MHSMKRQRRRIKDQIHLLQSNRFFRACFKNVYDEDKQWILDAMDAPEEERSSGFEKTLILFCAHLIIEYEKAQMVNKVISRLKAMEMDMGCHPVD